MSRKIKTMTLFATMAVCAFGMWSAQALAANVKGRYVCRVSSDGQGESAVVVLELDGAGNFTSSNKILVSRDFTDTVNCGAGNNDACPCVQSLTSPSSYTVGGGGTFQATLKWKPATATNPAACDTTTFGDVWAGGVSSGGKTIWFASTNNGDEAENGPGLCIKAP
jgi:hypothetical protein